MKPSEHSGRRTSPAEIGPLSAEEHTVLLGGSPVLNDQAVQSMRCALRGVRDWSNLKQCLEHHRVAETFYSNVIAFDLCGECPEGFLRDASRTLNYNSSVNATLMVEELALQQMLRAEGWPAVFIDAPGHLAAIYPAGCARHADVIEISVPRGHPSLIDGFDQCIRDLGYTRAGEDRWLTGIWRAFGLLREHPSDAPCVYYKRVRGPFSRLTTQLPYHPIVLGQLIVQVRLRHEFNADPAVSSANAGSPSFANRERAHLLALLCARAYHDTLKVQRAQLRFLMDALATLPHSLRRFPWDLVLREAARSSMMGPLYYVLTHLKRIFAAPIPDEVLSRIVRSEEFWTSDWGDFLPTLLGRELRLEVEFET